MKIVVCVKQILDTRVPLEAAESVTQKEPTPVYLMNPADRIALTQALEMKRAQPEGNILAITAGPARARQVLRESLAAGTDRAIHLNDEAFERADEYTTALCLSKVLRGIDYDVILCGNQSLDTGGGQVPVFLADLLDIPHITAAIKLERTTPSSFRLWRRLEKGKRQIVECPLPALFAIDKTAGQPRYVSEFSLQRAREERIEERTLGDLGLTLADGGAEASLVRTVRLSSPKPRTKKIYIPDGTMSAAQRMSHLLSGGGSAAKQSNLLEGSAEYLASQVVEYLTKEGIKPR